MRLPCSVVRAKSIFLTCTLPREMSVQKLDSRTTNHSHDRNKTCNMSCQIRLAEPGSKSIEDDFGFFLSLIDHFCKYTHCENFKELRHTISTTYLRLVTIELSTCSIDLPLHSVGVCGIVECFKYVARVLFGKFGPTVNARRYYAQSRLYVILPS